MSDVSELAEQLKSWHPTSWSRYIDPHVSEGHLTVNRFGSSYYWRVETRAAKKSVVPEMVRLADGRADTLEAAQAAAEEAWRSTGGAGLRTKEIEDLRASIEVDRARLAALESVPR